MILSWKQKARAALACTLVVAAACRGIVGIEDLKVVDGGPPGADSGADAAADAGADAVADAGDVINPDAAACKASGQRCRECCRLNFGPEIKELEQLSRTAGCICSGMPGSCTNECDSSACAASPTPSIQSCGGCVDGRVSDEKPPECQNSISECKKRPSCADAIKCLLLCN